SKGEGQFMAVLHNKNEASDSSYKAPSQKIDRIVFEFLNETITGYDKDSVRMYNGNPVYFTNSFEVPDKTAFSCGITIGEIRKNYILPHHQFFMAMGSDFKRKINLSADSEDIMRYLHGEEINADCENGWAVVTVDGCAVGGTKVVNGRAKNHYPKGLRLAKL
ncbi:MAG: hypothetical protein J6A60_08240, partial [Clostridia bacterium]|nr:hypothetical protein [Clostridia bacterium]